MPSSLAAVVDQAANSGVAFVCAIALMFRGSETAFAAFGLLSTYLALVSGVQTSLIGSPVQVLAGRLGTADRQGLLDRLTVYQCRTAGLLALALLVGAGLAALLGGLDATDAALVLACVLAFWLRDFQRTQNIVLAQPARLMFTALWSLAGALLVIGACLLHDGRISFADAVLALALPQVVAVLPMFGRAASAARTLAPGGLREVARQLWPLSGWAVMGGVLVWVQNQAHLSLAAGLAGVSAVAALAAGRLVISPATSAGTGLNRMNLSRFGSEFRRGGAAALLAARQRAIRAALALHGVYLALLGVAWWLQLDRLLPLSYQGIWSLVMLWFAFSALVGVRGCVTAAVQVLEGFRWMFKLSAWGCALALALALGGFQLMPMAHVFILAPLLTEIFFLAVASRRYRQLTQPA